MLGTCVLVMSGKDCNSIFSKRRKIKQFHVKPTKQVCEKKSKSAEGNKKCSENRQTALKEEKHKSNKRVSPKVYEAPSEVVDRRGLTRIDLQDLSPKQTPGFRIYNVNGQKHHTHAKSIVDRQRVKLITFFEF